MKFEFEVGAKEKHTVSFRFNKFWGGLKIKVDGETKVSDFRMYSPGLVETYRLIVGVQESYEVRIDKIRPQFFAGFRSNEYKVYLNDMLYKSYKD
ncbi:hypothetical protein [Taibaiella chishuiensis]|uniref:Uncharacterized protein n=1 Tax=Taibaiella chishuiensis TaxID=1434707 RepID=A0A2P8DA14_9BACT|nr:hypothetical protein [Taibaiella chishuiensis]PSK94021.1 hypothetical protein B0I18_101171 [Taibaiella chishuiensis]